MEQEPINRTSTTADPRVPEVVGAQAVRYRVDDLLVDVGRGRVTRKDEEVPLPKLSFDLLVVLLDAAPNLVSIDGLMERVWPGLVVSPETVSQRVKLLRTALADDPKHPRYVVGVRGRGYRLLADVVRIDPASGSKPAPLDRPKSRWIALGAVGAVLLALGAGIALWRDSGDSPSSPPQAPSPGQPMSTRSVAVLPFENLSTELDDKLLALGIAEAVLHQLANLNDLAVIARTSSFALTDRDEDARAIGRRLNARYLLEGSVQNDQQRLRVTAQLIDSQTGMHVWSMRFDRTPEDIFAVQDEIASQVAHQLASSVDADAGRRLTQRGTEKLDAWLPYLQGRALVATRRLADLEQAKDRFREAIRVDSTFASAYVALAEAELLSAYFPLSEYWFINGPDLPAPAQAEIEQLLSRALALDERNGEAYLLRGWLQTDHATAQADYRRGLALSPNNALGYERFARLLFFYPAPRGLDPAKRAEAFVLIDRARELDPLAPSGHLTKGMMMLYGRSDPKPANALILQALEHDPNYYPALMRLSELRGCCEGEFADAVRYGERALALEPNASWPQRLLIYWYLDIGEPDAAEQVLDESRERDSVGRLPLYLYRREWKAAGEVALSAGGPLSGIDRQAAVWAVSQYAHATGERVRTREYLEGIANVDWNDQNEPTIDDFTHDKSASVALAAILQASGDPARARLLLRAALREMDREVNDLGRGEMWYGITRPQSLALLGETDAAIEALRMSFDTGFMGLWWYRLERDTAYDTLRGDPRFVAILERVKAHVVAQRARLDSLRASGVVPTRVIRAARVSGAS